MIARSEHHEGAHLSAHAVGPGRHRAGDTEVVVVPAGAVHAWVTIPEA